MHVSDDQFRFGAGHVDLADKAGAGDRGIDGGAGRIHGGDGQLVAAGRLRVAVVIFAVPLEIVVAGGLFGIRRIDDFAGGIGDGQFRGFGGRRQIVGPVGLALQQRRLGRS